MTAHIQQLIRVDQPTGFQVILDQIAAILAVESANQQRLAEEAHLNPSFWKLRVFKERSNPWEGARDQDCDSFAVPIINVALDNMSYDGMAASETNLQRCTGVYNIDCYGFGVSVDTDEGHDPGDEEAAKEAHRAFRLVREMLMSGYYKYLRLRGLVGKRSIQSVTEFQPVIDSRPIQRVVGIRVGLAVDFIETSQQFEGEAMDLLSVSVIQAPDGEILFNADFPSRV